MKQVKKYWYLFVITGVLIYPSLIIGMLSWFLLGHIVDSNLVGMLLGILISGLITCAPIFVFNYETYLEYNFSKKKLLLINTLSLLIFMALSFLLISIST